MGYGFGVMIPVLMFGAVSGAHINPAMTIAQAVNGLFDWSLVLPYIIAQLLGAAAGQLVVYITYYPHYKDTENANAILGTFCTTDATTTASTTSSTSSSAPRARGRRTVLPVPAVGRSGPRCRFHRGRLHCVGSRDFHGRPDRSWLNPARDLMPRLLHAILPIPSKAPPAGARLDSGCRPDSGRYRGCVRVQVVRLIAFNHS